MYTRLSFTGFTLFELLITICILTIITLFAIPSYQHLKARQEAKNTIYQLDSLIRQNRIEAMSRHQDLVICSSQDGKNCAIGQWNHYLLTYSDQNHNRLLDTQEAILSTITLQLKYGALSLRNALHRNIITFKAENGLPQGYMGSFHYCSQYDTALDQKIVMNMMGNSRIERRSCLIP